MKKAQLLSMPFVYVFIIIVLVFVIYFGVKTIKNVVDLGETVEYKTFVIKLEERFDTVMTLDKGSSVSLEELNFPKEIEEICFISGNRYTNLNSVKNSDLRDLLNTGLSESNVFFADGKVLNEKIDYTLILEENPLCDSTIDGKIDLRLVNEGREVSIERL